MKRIALWMLIGSISGIVLALFMKVPQLIWGDKAYNLLFDVSYVPILKEINPVWLARGIFHFTTCILSLSILYRILCLFNRERSLTFYAVVIGVGSSILFFLTLLAENTPAITDYEAWAFWTIGHILFSWTGWYLIQKWIVKQNPS